MLTLTIDGRAVTLSSADAAFLSSSLHAAISHHGHHFERTHRGAASVFRVSVDEAARELPAGVQTFGADASLSGKVTRILNRDNTAYEQAEPAAPGATLTDC